MAQSPMRAITGAHPGNSRFGQGTLPAHRPARRQRGDGREHPRAPSRAHAATDGARSRRCCVSRTGTRVNFTRRGQTQGLGVIGTNQTGAAAPRSGPAHDAGRQSRRGPVGGAFGAGFDAPLAPDPDRKGSKPREERKSFRWVEGLRDCGQAAQRMPETRVVCTMDREGRLPRPVHRAPRARTAGRLAGPCEGRPRPGQGYDARWTPSLAAFVRPRCAALPAPAPPVPSEV